MVTRVATPGNEDFLLRIAQHERKLAYYQDRDGMWIIHAKLPKEAGVLVVNVIEAVAKQDQSRVQEPMNEEGKDVSAETFSELVEKEQPNPCRSTTRRAIMAHD
jgi:hypothetical protein